MTTPTGYAEMFEWADGNPDNEDRAGCTVALVLGDRIRIATKFDKPIGVVGGDNTSVSAISGGSPDEWQGKHLRDPVNRLLWEPQVMVEWVDKALSFQTMQFITTCFLIQPFLYTGKYKVGHLNSPRISKRHPHHINHAGIEKNGLLLLYWVEQ
jgi:hypothetical protein